MFDLNNPRNTLINNLQSNIFLPINKKESNMHNINERNRTLNNFKSINQISDKSYRKNCKDNILLRPKKPITNKPNIMNSEMLKIQIIENKKEEEKFYKNNVNSSIYNRKRFNNMNSKLISNNYVDLEEGKGLNLSLINKSNSNNNNNNNNNNLMINKLRFLSSNIFNDKNKETFNSSLIIEDNKLEDLTGENINRCRSCIVYSRNNNKLKDLQNINNLKKIKVNKLNNYNKFSENLLESNKIERSNLVKKINNVLDTDTCYNISAINYKNSVKKNNNFSSIKNKKYNSDKEMNYFNNNNNNPSGVKTKHNYNMSQLLFNKSDNFYNTENINNNNKASNKDLYTKRSSDINIITNDKITQKEKQAKMHKLNKRLENLSNLNDNEYKITLGLNNNNIDQFKKDLNKKGVNIYEINDDNYWANSSNIINNNDNAVNSYRFKTNISNLSEIINKSGFDQYNKLEKINNKNFKYK